PWERLDDLVPLYQQLLSLLRAGGAGWVQLDEPALVTDLDAAQLEKVTEVYGALTASADRPAVCVATYFGDPGPALEALGATEIDAVAVDLVAGGPGALAATTAFHDRLVLAGVVDGRNIWRTDLDGALGTLATALGSSGSLAVSTSCSTLHLPYSLEPESDLDPGCGRGWPSPRRSTTRSACSRTRCGTGATPGPTRSTGAARRWRPAPRIRVCAT